MTTDKRTKEEITIKRVVLLGSTFVVLFVSLIIGYILISSEINGFREHLNSFKTTLIEKEKFSLKIAVKNLVNDIKYEEISTKQKTKQQVQTQSITIYNLAHSLYLQNRDKNKEDIIELIKEIIKSATKKTNEIHYFIFNKDGTLLLNTKTSQNEGKNFIDFKDINGEKFIKHIIKNEGFTEFFWYKQNGSEIVKKVTYSKILPNLNIIIGASGTFKSKRILDKKIIDKLEKTNLIKDEFIFIYNVKSLNDITNSSNLILEKNIKASIDELNTIKHILISNDYKADVFYTYGNKLIYSTFLPQSKTFVSVGVYLDSINKIIQDKTMFSNADLSQKIESLVFTIFVITSIFFMLSYIVSKKIETMFKNYRIKISKNQQLLIQKSKMASMGEMVGNIAHQWRQPLSQLSGLFFDIESAHDYKELDKKYITKISDEANDLIEYMSKTIDDFKEFYNPNTKKERFNLLESIQNSLKVISSSLKYHKIEVLLHVDKSLHVEGLSNEFSQVILNIVSNTKDIALFKDIKNPKINIYSKLKDNKISLHVEDNCGGIEEKNLEKIFEPYFTTKYNYGTGIGLYMSKVIIENKMKAKIFAKNTKSGALFIIQF